MAAAKRAEADPAAGVSPDEIACDALVVGSGSAGLVAALVCASAGLRTVIVEKAPVIGGTTALSGAGTWIPANHHAAAAGLRDSPDDAFRYLCASAPPDWQARQAPLWRSFVDHAPAMLRFVEARTPLLFALAPGADLVPSAEGARETGRMLAPMPLRPAILGLLAASLRPPLFPHIYTYQEAVTADLYVHPVAAAIRYAPKLLWRLLTGRRTKGTALVVGLLRGCLDAGCTVLTGTRATGLLMDPQDGRIVGAWVEREGRKVRIHATRGTVLATGGFEWDAARLKEHFPGPVDFLASPPTNTGDGHRMAAEVGAELALMDQANIGPALPMAADPRAQGLSVFFHRQPGIILVDRDGHRFVDEHRVNLGEVLDRRDPVTGLPVHLPAWLVADSRFERHSPVFRFYARRKPGWLIRERSLAALAGRISIPAAALAETVERYNAMCAAGRDADFGRRAMRRIDGPPFVAVPFNRSITSTKGGPRTNVDGQVLRPDGSVVDGLYCAGVAMANPIGTRGVGSGTTIGPNMTWGYICGRHIAAHDPALSREAI